MPGLASLVLRCADVDTTAAFYRALGIELVEEQHGAGPRHLSGQLGPTLIELYPATESRPPEVGLRTGMTVDDGAQARLEAAGHQRRPGAGMSFLDPDGRIVVLTAV